MPSIVTRKVPVASALRMQCVERVEFAVSVTAGQVTVKPFTGLASELSTTVPAKLRVLVTLTEITELLPRSKLTGLPMEIEKSPTWTTTLAE